SGFGNFTQYLDELSSRMLPKSALGKAITYARNQREALRQYVNDGRLTIENNMSEWTLRLQAIGLKNWEFLESEAARPRAVVLFTILAGAKCLRLEPWAYLRNVLLRLSVGRGSRKPCSPTGGRQATRSTSYRILSTSHDKRRRGGSYGASSVARRGN